MNRSRALHGSICMLLLLLGAAACHNTARGVREDTSRALQKTGEGLEKAGDRIGGHKNQGDR